VIDLSHLRRSSEQNLKGYSFECSSLFMSRQAKILTADSSKSESVVENKNKKWQKRLKLCMLIHVMHGVSTIIRIVLISLFYPGTQFRQRGLSSVVAMIPARSIGTRPRCK
jgi:hypothetical protein